MNKTKIEWCDYTINPVKGLCPMACSYCYARAMYRRFKWNPEIRFEPIRDADLPKKPSLIFVGSTMELFGEWVDASWLDSIFRSVEDSPYHTFIFLTKLPQNLTKWNPFPRNCWVGVSVTRADMFDDALNGLDDIHCSKRFISAEPLLQSLIPDGLNKIDFSSYLAGTLDWVICGAQTPPSKKTTPKLEWIQEIVEACDKARIPIFLKNNLTKGLPIDRPFYKPIPLSGWDDNFSWELRQEFP